MRKILLIFAVLFVSCFEVQVKPREVNAQTNIEAGSAIGADGITYRYKTEQIDGMKFGIWYATGGTSQTGYDIEIVNLTKEALEVELLQAQLQKKQKSK